MGRTHGWKYYWAYVMPALMSIAWAASASAQTFDAQGETFKLDRYADTDTAKQPVVVLVHGIDGLGGDSGKQIKAFAEELRDNGYLAFVPHYFGTNDGKDDGTFDPVAFEKRLANYGKYPERIAAAITEAIADPRAEKDQLGLIGFSLGGGLVLAHAQSASGTVDAVVDFFGYIPPGSDIYANVAKLPPTIVFHNNADDFVKVVHSKKLIDALAKTTVTHDHKFFDDKNPGKKNHPFLPGGEADKKSRSMTLDWLKAHVK